MKILEPTKAHKPSFSVCLARHCVWKKMDPLLADIDPSVAEGDEEHRSVARIKP